MPEIILDDDRLLRRVQFLDPNFIKPDGTPASSSFSLKSGEDGLSVDVERLTTHARAIQDRARFRLYALRAGYTRSLGLEPAHDPLEENHAHCLLRGSITRGTARNLAKSAVRVAYPD
jgi:hypothetical protein